MSANGIYRALVVDNDDPEGLLRLRVRVPQLLGQAVTDWAWPSLPVAVGVTVPNVDEPVWVAFEGGEIDRPVWLGVWRTYRPGGAAGPDFSYGGVVTETSFDQAPSSGSATSVARSDHTHGTPPIYVHQMLLMGG